MQDYPDVLVEPATCPAAELRVRRLTGDRLRTDADGPAERLRLPDLLDTRFVRNELMRLGGSVAARGAGRGQRRPSSSSTTRRGD